MRRAAGLAAVLVAAAVLLVAELGAGGLDYGSGKLHDPCRPRPALEGVAGGQRWVLRGLDEIACRSGRSREQLVLELADRGVDVAELVGRLQGRLEDWRDRIEEILDELGR